MPAFDQVGLNRSFLSGDENSAQDAKSMLDACASLMGDFGCSVLLVHHTGVSEEAQARARGSSAWRGALDIEISVSPAKDDKPITITQRKSKDAEMAAPLHASLASLGVKDLSQALSLLQAATDVATKRIESAKTRADLAAIAEAMDSAEFYALPEHAAEELAYQYSLRHFTLSGAGAP